MLIKVVGRDVGLGMVCAGVEGDHRVADLIFVGLPEMDNNPVVTLHWTTGEAGDIVALDRVAQGWRYEVTDALTQYGGAQISAYLQVVSGEQRWHSNAFVLRVNNLPGVDATVMPPEPSVIDQMIAMVQQGRQEMSDALIELVEGVEAVGQVLSEVEGYADQVSEDAPQVAADKYATHGFMVRAETAADGAEDSAQAAEASLDKLTTLTATAETLSPGSAATVAKTTTPDGYTLAFGVPRGDKGERGEQGERGATGERGLKGDKGDPGEVTQVQLDAVTSQLAEIDTRVDALETRTVKLYGVLWDGVNAQCVRTRDAAGIPVVTTNFGHFGAVNPSKANPFDALYPWRDRGVVNIDMTAYASLLTSGGEIEGCISAYCGDPGFKWDGSNGPVMVYTPEFWMRAAPYGGNGGLEIIVADGALEGFAHVSAHIGGRWFAVDDGAGGVTSKPGLPLVNVAMSTIHARAKAVGMTLDDIYTYCADSVLQVVEYAKMDTQAAFGKGDDSSYRQSSDLCSIAATDAEYVIVSNATAAFFRVGAQLDIGTTNGGTEIGRKVVTSITDHDASNKRLNFAGALTTTTASMISSHGMVNTEDGALGNDSGYLGTNGYCHTYYRGQINHAGRWRYVLGIYRQTGTGKVWIASNRAQCDLYDALNTSNHIDTGIALPQAAEGAPLVGYIKTLAFLPPLFLAPICIATGGSSSAPIGDYFYNPALSAENTVLIVGGAAYIGSSAGRFYGGWFGTAGRSDWYYAGVPFLKSP